MKFKIIFGLMLFICIAANGQNLHNHSNAASLTNESNATTGWSGLASISSDNEDPLNGIYSIRVESISSNSRVAQYSFSAVVGETYDISIWAKAGVQNYRPAFANWSGLSGFSTTSIDGTNWVQYNWTVTATSTSPIIRIYTSPKVGGAVGDTIFFDALSITPESFTDTENPSTITSLSSTNTTSTSTQLNWTASTDNIGVTDYQVFQNGSSIGLTGGATTFNVSGLSVLTSYTFTVLAFDGAGNVSSAGNTVNITTLAGSDTEDPSAVTSLSSTNATSTSTQLNWTASTDNIGVSDYEVFQNGSSIGLTGGATTFNVSGLSVLTSYTFTVLAFDGAGNVSSAGNTVNITTLAGSDTEDPSAVTSLSSTNMTSTSTQLNWTASTDNIGVTDYQVFQNGSSIGLTGGATTFNVSGLSVLTSYTFTVLAFDGAGNVSSAGNTVNITTLAGSDTEDPSAVTSLSSTNATSTSTQLNWTASTDNIGVTDYQVFQNGSSIGLTGGATTFNVSGLSVLTSYTFTVLAFDGAGNVSSAGNTVNITTLAGSDTEDPSAVTSLSSTNTTSTSTQLNWTASTDNIGVSDYEVFQNGSSIGLTGGATTFNVSGLSVLTSYTFTVLAFDGAGNVSSAGNTVNITTLAGSDTEDPSAVTSLSSTNMTSTSTQLNWTASTDNIGVTDYQVFQNGSSIGLTGGATTFNVSGLSVLTSYTFTVLAFDGAGNVSSAGNTVNITTLAGSDTEDPSAVTSLSSTNTTSTSTQLNWTASTDNIGVTDYQVFQNGSSIGLTGGATTFNVSGLSVLTSYTFTVLAFDGAGNVSSAGNTTNVTTLNGTIITDYTSENSNLITADWRSRDFFADRNVGIGTTNTEGYRLAVAGGVVAESVKVALQTNWPDFVFENDYDLRTIDEVRAYIKKYGHLENLPSAETVSEEGINLGEMNALLLRKIEELTLYLIEQDNKIKELKLQNSRVDKLEERLILLEKKATVE